MPSAATDSAYGFAVSLQGTGIGREMNYPKTINGQEAHKTHAERILFMPLRSATGLVALDRNLHKLEHQP
jgi:hypothetical protein